MSFKKAFKYIFRDYERYKFVSLGDLEEIAEKQGVSFYKLEKAVMDKGLVLVP